MSQIQHTLYCKNEGYEELSHYFQCMVKDSYLASLHDQ